MSIAVPTETPRSIAGVAAITLLFVALVVLLDGPIWLVKLVPTQDGPVHLAQADLIARFGWGGALQEPGHSTNGILASSPTPPSTSCSPV